MRQSRDVPMSEILKKGVLLPEELRDQEIAAKFDLPKEEMFLKEINCKIKTAEFLLPQYSTFSITEHFFCFTLKAKRIDFKIEISKVTEVTLLQKKNRIRIRTKDNQIKIMSLVDPNSVYTFCKAIWEKEAHIVEEITQQPHETLELNEDDWKILTKAAKNIKYPKNQVINTTNLEPSAKAEEEARYIFRIISGSCRAKSPTKDFILNPGAIFGETTFINGPLVHPYDVITNEVTFIAVIDAYYLNVVFQHFPELAGKFYRWISKVLCARLIQLGFIR